MSSTLEVDGVSKKAKVKQQKKKVPKQRATNMRRLRTLENSGLALVIMRAAIARGQKPPKSNQ
jgi:hypothetical protein